MTLPELIMLVTVTVGLIAAMIYRTITLLKENRPMKISRKFSHCIKTKHN